MTRTTKVYKMAEFKALPSTEGEGRFTALVSVYGNVDLQGDRVMKGAFDASLRKWGKSGDPIPICWSHDWSDPFAHIGYADARDVTETDRGLLVKGQLDVDTNPFAKQVYDLMKQRRIKEFSFAYDIQDERRGKDGANELLQLGIIEVGPTLKGANPDTELLSVKSALESARREPDIAWVRAKMEELGLVEAKAPANGATGGMREHLMTGPPKGHGMAEAKVSGMSIDEMAAAHNSMHDSGDMGHGKEMPDPEPAPVPVPISKVSVKDSRRLSALHDTLLALGYEGCSTATSGNGESVKEKTVVQEDSTVAKVEVQEDSKSTGESPEDADLRIKALLAEMSG